MTPEEKHIEEQRVELYQRVWEEGECLYETRALLGGRLMVLCETNFAVEYTQRPEDR